MNNRINNNGYDYVDLVLPSGTLWAACNIGASKASDYGLYFQWGDTIGYTKDQVGKNKLFNWGNYKFSIKESGIDFSKYITTSSILDLKDDAANVNMGGDWHMPTPYQIKELISKTTNTWVTTPDGVNGIMFTSTDDTSKSIFFPMAGYAWNDLVGKNGDIGCIWSSMLSDYNVSCGQWFFFSPVVAGMRYYGRFGGFPIRGVIDKAKK